MATAIETIILYKLASMDQYHRHGSLAFKSSYMLDNAAPTWIKILEDETEIFHSIDLYQKSLDEEEGLADLRAHAHNVIDHGLYTHVSAMDKVWARAVQAGKPFDKDFDLYF